jgi:voltage-gated potassium channel
VDLEIDEYSIGPSSPLVGHTLRDSPLRRSTNATVVAIKRADGKAIFSPDPDAVLAAGDTLILVGPSGISSRLGSI